MVLNGLKNDQLDKRYRTESTLTYVWKFKVKYLLQTSMEKLLINDNGENFSLLRNKTDTKTKCKYI
jgi:hypothetical protein